MAALTQLMQNLLDQKDALLANDTRRIFLKEFLQVYILDFLYNHSTYRRLNFYGGTCLHFLYGLNRLSEDIDLDNSNKIDLTHFEEDLLDYFHSRIEYDHVTLKIQIGERGIRRTTLKFPVLYELGLTSQPDESLHVKVEISQHQQIAEIRKTPVILYGHSFVPAHFSLESMMAGKIIACLEWSFQKGSTGIGIKGRDYYDLLWFMQQKVHPHEEKLEKDGKISYTVQSAMRLLEEKIDTIRMSDLETDLLPLFEQRQFIETWLEGFKENFRDYLRTYL